jgi:hypothetical protein
MSSQADLDKEILEARKKFGEMYGNLKLGGKGKFLNKIFPLRYPKKKKVGRS